MTDTPKSADKNTPPKKTPPGDRIAKVLSRAGIASRREAERMIQESEFGAVLRGAAA